MKIRFLLLLLLLISPVIFAGENRIPKFNKDFVQYIQVCENGIRKGWNDQEQKWFPYWDGSGHNVAYGHLITKGEDFSKGITEQQALTLLDSDLQKAHEKARLHFAGKGYDLTKFTTRQVEIVVDFTFNACLYSHPKMMLHVANSDLEGQRKEYKRFAVLNGKRTEIKDRNTRFFNRYLR